ncbi:MAG: hypothetical protein HY805_07355 [Nitrospirae bacterium]|nr:hypothetical protein [Nitrospirota bacterium]
MIAKKESNWVTVSRQTYRYLFSELDVLLRALDRFFRQSNKSFSKDVTAGKNFRNELTVARDTTLRILGVLEVVIPENKKNAYGFQKFAEAKLFDDMKRDFFTVEIYKQDTPEKGLYLLYDSFINLKGIITDLLRNENITYVGFTNIGEVIVKSIRDNAFFNPFIKDINPEFDTIENHRISEIVRNINDRNVKKAVSLIFVQLFRFLRHLGHVDITTPRYTALHSSLLITILLRFEIEAFRNYIERIGNKLEDERLKETLQSLSYQFSMETKRVYLQELKDIFEKKAPKQLRGKIENSHGILKNLSEQAIIQIAQVFSPLIKGEEIFSSFTTKIEQSLKLREDIYVFDQILSRLEKEKQELKKGTAILKSLRSFMSYFESFTFRLLRHDDYEEFLSFFEEIQKFMSDTITAEEFERALEICRHFRIFLETTLRHIENRAELLGKPLDVKKSGMLLSQYV